MDSTDSTDSPLEMVAGTVGPRATEAFTLLAHETRLAILLVLWDAFEPWGGDDAVMFAELRRCVGMPDGSQFNYHLQQLVGHFVRRTDDGYELRRAGHEIVQAVIAGTGFEAPAFGPTEVDSECMLCGAPMAVEYSDQMLFWTCTECNGLFGQRNDYPDGTTGAYEFPPAGLTDRTPQEVLNASLSRRTKASALSGVCDACAGQMDRWLHRCDDHADEGICPNCDRRHELAARFRCSVCKHYHSLHPAWLVLVHPAVVGFYYDHGVAFQYEDGVTYQPRTRSDLHHDLTLASEDPLRVRVTVRYDGDELQLTLDENLNIVAVTGAH